LTIARLLRALKLKPKKRLHREWELIGERNYRNEDFERVPPWVKEHIAGIYRHGPGSSLGLKTYYLKGKTYRYKLAFGGQGGPILHVYRRNRSR
jgi:hypothetical protein